MAWNDAITESTDWTALAFFNQFVAARNERENIFYPYPGMDQCPLGIAGTEVGGDGNVGWDYDWENELTVYIGLVWIRLLGLRRCRRSHDQRIRVGLHRRQFLRKHQRPCGLYLHVPRGVRGPGGYDLHQPALHGAPSDCRRGLCPLRRVGGPHRQLQGLPPRGWQVGHDGEPAGRSAH